MVINVTQDHIDKGLARSCYLCPVAQAITDVLPGEHFLYNHVARVDIGQCTIFVDEHTWVGPLPPEVDEWITNFDYDQDEVQPFSFELPIDHLLVKQP